MSFILRRDPHEVWEDSLGSVNRSRNIKHLRRDPHEVWEDSLGSVNLGRYVKHLRGTTRSVVDSLGSVNRSRYAGLFRSVLDFQGIWLPESLEYTYIWCS